MRVVVTGALGHIGSRLIRELPRRFPGCELVLIDNLSAQRYCSLFDLPGEGRYRFVEGDVTKAELGPLFKGADTVIHLAAITNAAGSFENQREVEENNFKGTEKVAQACLEAGASLIYLSSTSIYGTQADVVDEDCSEAELQPQSPYAETKLREERLLEGFARERGLKHITCRFGTIFGTSPGMRFHTAVNKFCWQAVTGTPLTVWRTAYDQKRPYLDLLDAMDAFELILRKRLFDGRIYNVLTANLTVGDIVTAIREHVPALDVTLTETRIMNQLSYEVLDARFRAQGFTPSGDIRKGVSDTIRLLDGARSLSK
jgi:nucleoside-diphosphate-sugar epimerase